MFHKLLSILIRHGYDSAISYFLKVRGNLSFSCWQAVAMFRVTPIGRGRENCPQVAIANCAGAGATFENAVTIGRGAKLILNVLLGMGLLINANSLETTDVPAEAPSLEVLPKSPLGKAGWFDAVIVIDADA